MLLMSYSMTDTLIITAQMRIVQRHLQLEAVEPPEHRHNLPPAHLSSVCPVCVQDILAHSISMLMTALTGGDIVPMMHWDS